MPNFETIFSKQLITYKKGLVFFCQSSKVCFACMQNRKKNLDYIKYNRNESCIKFSFLRTDNGKSSINKGIKYAALQCCQLDHENSFYQNSWPYKFGGLDYKVKHSWQHWCCHIFAALLPLDFLFSHCKCKCNVVGTIIVFLSWQIYLLCQFYEKTTLEFRQKQRVKF